MASKEKFLEKIILAHSSQEIYEIYMSSDIFVNYGKFYAGYWKEISMRYVM